jgi:PAS domain S-box-containing protein
MEYKMATKVVTFRLPEDLIEAITLQANASGRCKTAVVIDALKQAFGFPSSPTSASLEGLHKKQEALQKEVAFLNQQLSEFGSETHSYGSTRYLEELHQVTATSQPLLDEVFLPSPTAYQTHTVEKAIDLTDSSRVDSQESEPDSGGRSNELDETLQNLVAKVEHRARMLEQVLTASVDHVCMYDRLGRYTYANRAFMQSFSLERTELYGKTWQQIGLPLDPMKMFEAKLQIALATGQSIAEEMALPTVNGVRDYEYILSPIHSTDGSVEAVVYTARDITERKQAEESLRESEKNYRNLFEWASDSIFITDSSTQHLLDVNEHAARRLGYTRKQLLHLPAEVISPPMDPEHRAAVIGQLWKVGSVTFEHVHQCKNGAQMPVEISSRVVEYGGQLAIQSFVRDITQRKLAQENLALYREVISHLREAIAIADLQGRYLEQNPAHNLLLGYLDDELPELTIPSLLGEDVFAAMTGGLSKNGGYRGEVTSRTKSGELLALELATFVVCNEAGEPVWYVETKRQISKP